MLVFCYSFHFEIGIIHDNSLFSLAEKEEELEDIT